MGKNKEAVWREMYIKIVDNANLNDTRTDRLLVMLASSKQKYEHLKAVNPSRAAEYYKTGLMDLRKTIAKFEAYNRKAKMSKSKAKIILKGHNRKLREPTLYEQVILMELTENSGHFIYKEEPSEGYTRSWLRTFLKSLNYLTPEAAEKKCAAVVNRMLSKIDRARFDINVIRYRTAQALEHIDELDSAINYVKDKHCTDFKIMPYLKRFYWLAPERRSHMKATIVKDRKHCLPKRKRQYAKQQKFEVRQSYILDNVPEFMPQMYQHLEQPRKLIRVK